MKKSLCSMVTVGLGIVFVLFLFAGTASAQSVKILKVGTVLPLNFGMGVDTKNAIEMLVSDFNAAGGITIKSQRYNIDLIVYDDKWTAEGGRAAMERLVYQDKVNYLISIISSPTIVSGLNLVEQAKILNLCAGTTPSFLIRNSATRSASQRRGQALPPSGPR